MNTPSAEAAAWPEALYRMLRRKHVAQVSYVPDAGHTSLIHHFEADPEVRANVLTSEEEGVAIGVGAWLGGLRSVLLMQSSGVGNCINMLSLPVLTKTPFLTLVTMRGEWNEFNPWQVPMGRATQASLEAIGVAVVRAESVHEVVDVAEQAATMAYEADGQIAVLIAQRVLGKKTW